MQTSDLTLLGPLAKLVGTWQGALGDDTAPDDNRGTEKNKFREKFIFTPFRPLNNHEQYLYGVGYTRTAWRLTEDFPFHEQFGYWVWDAKAQQVMHSFIIPRGMTVLAGGTATASARSLKVSASLGSPTFGICSNPFLDEEFKTVRFDATLTFIDELNFSYEENTQIKMKGQHSIFNHIDKNTLKKTN